MNTKRQFLVTIRIDAENSEEAEYFFDYHRDQPFTLDVGILDENNHEVIEHEEIFIKEKDPKVLLRAAISNLCLISCNRCGHYAQQGWTCPQCGHDNSDE
jgi:rubrerythrin